MALLRLPKLIDCHAHFREPGPEWKETMRTGAAAAKAGGVGIECDMPNTDPPTVTIAALADKVRRAESIADCDIRFFFGATESAHLREFTELWTGTSGEMWRLKARCCGLKLYLDHSTGNQRAGGDTVEEAFRLGGRLGFVIVAHCEDPEINAQARAAVTRTDIAAHSLIRPPESEAAAVEFGIALARKHGSRFHVAHLSTKGGLELIRAAKREGLPVTCEVAPHHLLLTADDYASLGTLAKTNPPLRLCEDQAALWAGIADGTIDCVASDHAPHTLEEKLSESPLDAPSGVPGVETMLPLLLSVALGQWPHPTSSRPTFCTLTIEDIRRICFTNPNRIFALGAPDEESLTVNPDIEWTIRAADLHSQCGWTPYEGWRVAGRLTKSQL